MSNIEFFINRDRDGYTIKDGEGEILGDGFRDEHAAADMAIRFAQESDLLYSIYYC